MDDAWSAAECPSWAALLPINCGMEYCDIIDRIYGSTPILSLFEIYAYSPFLKIHFVLSAVYLFFSPPLNGDQIHLLHLLGKGERTGFLQFQKGLNFLVCDLTMLLDVIQYFFHLDGEDGSGFLFSDFSLST